MRADGRDLYWLEARPADAGRTTLVRWRDGRTEDVSPPGGDVRTRYLEYGGGGYTARGGVVLRVDLAEQRVWRAAGPGEDGPVALTPPTDGKVRWSAPRIDPARRSVLVLREDQRDPDLEPVNSLVRLDLDGPHDHLGTVLVAGRERRRADRAGAEADTGEDAGDDGGGAPDFVTDPALSPDGSHLAWLTWDHPRMPWDGTTLWLARVDEAGDLRDVRAVAGGPQESLEQPLWLDDTTLLCLSDRSGWSGLYRLDLQDREAGLVPVVTDELELGVPRWVPDLRSYDRLPDGRVVSGRSRDGGRELVVLDPATGRVAVVPTPTTYVREVAVLAGGTVAVEASRADLPATILLVDLTEDGTGAVVRPAVPEGPSPVPPGFAPTPESVSWTSTDGAVAYGILYRPTHPDVVGPQDERPPLVVMLHGGPTSCAVPGLRPTVCWWTSRGFAVLDVNYGGSTGYGRAYRQRLDGRWGEVDVQDAASGAQHLADTGVVDAARLLITGGSAGGFTTLAAATFTDTFAAGASHYGISDLRALATDTHKLESRYLDGLIGPWPAAREVYDARSPIRHVDRLRTPLILLQGSEDLVVPPAQAASMAEALRERGLPVALVVIEGEGHGFRRLDNQVRALEAELSFYAQVLRLSLADDLDPVPVENLPPR